jgi:lysylphosphatidylglycerol synthetase-like protein (DUF2156 family)
MEINTDGRTTKFVIMAFFAIAAPLIGALVLSMITSLTIFQWALYSVITIIWWMCLDGGAKAANKEKAATLDEKPSGWVGVGLTKEDIEKIIKGTDGE